MTDAERLENMSPIGVDAHGNLLVKHEDWFWLQEQAGLVQELERNIKLLEGQKGIKTALNNEAIKIIEEKERKNKHYREALEFYADNKNYEVNVIDQWAPEIKVMMDGGAKAAEILEVQK